MPKTLGSKPRKKKLATSTLIPLKSTTERGAIVEAIQLSKKHPGKYILVNATFGLFATIHNRLNVHAPGDGPFNWYALNGQKKNFTKKQIIADELATPTLF